MRPKPFGVERWFGRYEFTTGLNIAESCIRPLTLEEIKEITGRDIAAETARMPLGYTESNGDARLRKAIAALYDGRVDPDSIIVTNGAIEANYLAFAAEIEPGDEVVAVHPAYQQLHEIPASLGARVKKWPMRKENGWAPDLDELKRLVDGETRLLVLNFPHNPTGFAPGAEFMREVCAFAAHRGIAVHSDEVYRGLRLDGGGPTPSALEFMPSATVVGSASKAFGLSGARIGWLVAEPRVIRRCLEHRDYVSICPPIWSEVVARVVFENKDRVLARNRRIALENYATLARWAEENQDVVGVVPPREGVVCFPWLKFPASSEDFCSRLVEEEDVLLLPGSCFEMEGHFRIGFGYDGRKLDEGLRRLARFARRYRSERPG